MVVPEPLFTALLFSTNQPIEAQRPRSGVDQVQEDEAVEDRQFAAVIDGPGSVPSVLLEIRHSHLSAKQESYGPGEQAEKNH